MKEILQENLNLRFAKEKFNIHDVERDSTERNHEIIITFFFLSFLRKNIGKNNIRYTFYCSFRNLRSLNHYQVRYWQLDNLKNCRYNIGRGCTTIIDVDYL